MAAQFHIDLQGLRFHAFHGLYEEEKKLGNEFEVDVVVHYTAQGDLIRHIEDTVNYVAVYEVVKRNMSMPTPLLETLVQQIAVEIATQFPSVERISVSIRKLHPPIVSFVGSVGVKYLWERPIVSEL